MRKENKALFISLMAFILALFAYFNKSNKEGIVPGFEEKMKSNWVITNRGGPEDDIVFSHKNDIKFSFKANGQIECKSGKYSGDIDCRALNAGIHVKSANLCECKRLVVKDEAKIANWRHKAARIGIPQRGDIELGQDNWVRLMNFDKGTYAGVAGRGGWAGFNLWSDASKKGRCYCGGYGGPGSYTPVVSHRHKFSPDIIHTHKVSSQLMRSKDGKVTGSIAQALAEEVQGRAGWRRR